MTISANKKNSQKKALDGSVNKEKLTGSVSGQKMSISQDVEKKSENLEKDVSPLPENYDVPEKEEPKDSSESKKDKVIIERPRDKKSNLKWLILVIIGAIILVALFVYAFLLKPSNFINPLAVADDSESTLPVSLSAEKSFENPLNGMYFSEEEADKFKDKKPVAVMVNNYEAARPSFGLSYADVVYEAVAEGGITRLMPIFYSRIPEKVSSVRSARYYFVELASGYKAHYFHWGAAHVPPCQKAPPSSSDYCPPVNGKVETNPKVDAYSRIVQLGVPNLDGGNYSCEGTGCAFGRDPEKVGKVPLEHTAFVRLPLALELAREIRPDESWHKYIPVTEWMFKDDAPMDQRGNVGISSPITYNYWDLPAFTVEWSYDKDSNEYIRTQGGVVQKDALNGQELRAKVVIVRFTKQEPVGDKKNHLYHQLVGTGDAVIFQDGTVVKAKWTRSTHDERDSYIDLEGNPLKFTRGQIWVQLVPEGKEISYSQGGQETSDTPVSPIGNTH